MSTKLKKLMSVILVLALIVPGLAFAETSEGLETISEEEAKLYERVAERSKEIRDKLKTKTDIELDKEVNDTVRIIVELEDRPAISFATDKGISYSQLSLNERTAIESDIYKIQERVKSDIKSQRINIKFERDFSVAFNGFSGIVKFEDIERIEKISGVRNVYISQEYTRPEVDIDMKSSHEVVGSYPTWELGYKGEGMVIAIIDSGVDPSHKDFVISEGTEVALTKEYVESLDLPGKYFTEKVPYGYNYFDLNDEILDLGPGASEHGMHVAGTAAANGNPEEGGIKGVAPEAQILAMKVFSNDPTFTSTYDDIYLDAIDDAIKLGADALNMSLGSTAGFVNYESATSKAIKNAVESGVVCAISAGNAAQFGNGMDLPYKENPDIGLVGSPGLARDSLQVAGIENIRNDQNYLTYTVGGAYEALPSQTVIIDNEAYDLDVLDIDVEVQLKVIEALNAGKPVYVKLHYNVLVPAESNDIYTELPEDLQETVIYYDSEGNSSIRGVLGEVGSGDGEVVKIPMLVSSSSPVLPSDVFDEPMDYVYCGIGTAEEFVGVDVVGKIALVQRGNTFTDTITNAEANGAAGVIVFNHATGGEELINMAYPDGGTIPAAFIGNKGGMELLEKEGTVKISFPEGLISADNPRAGYMYDYTSWGTTPNLELKPEITAPAVRIYSTLQNDKYGTMSGTSMASPHVAGGSALVMQYIKQHDQYKELSREQQARLAKVFLMNTADIIPNPDSDTPYSPRRQGAGVMNLHGAVTTPVRVIDAKTSEAKVELKDFQNKNFDITLKVINDSDEEVTYDIDVQVLADEIVKGAGYYPHFDYITLNTREVDADITGDGTVSVPANSSKDITIDVDFSEDKEIYKNMFIEGFVILKDVEDDKPTLSVPYVGFYGDWNEPRILDGMHGIYDEKPSFYEVAGMVDEDLYYYDPVAMSPGTVWGDMFATDSVIPVLSFLRNAEEVEFNILDESENKLRTIYRDINVRKNYYDEGYASAYVILDDATWDGTVKGEIVPDGKYYYEIKSKINYEGADYQSLKIPVYIDTQEPVVTNIQYDSENEVLTWEADDGEGSGIYLFDILVNRQPVLDLPITVTEEKDQYSLEISLNMDEVQRIEIDAYDYAWNVGRGVFGEDVEYEIPLIYLNTPIVTGIYNEKEIEFNGYVESLYSITEVTIDGNPVEFAYDPITGTYLFNATIEYEDGYYEAIIAAKTNTGAEASISRMFWVDATDPVVEVGEEITINESNNAVVNITMKDNFPYFELYIDDSQEFLYDGLERFGEVGEEVEITKEFELPLSEGVNEFVIRLVDFANNEITETVTIEESGNIAWDPGNTGGKGLNVNVDGNTITFNGEIEWYPADESLGRAAGHRVGVEIIPPEGFDAKEAVVTINGKGYKFGEDRFFWYPLVTEAGQEFRAEVEWKENFIEIFKVVISEDATLAEKPVIRDENSVTQDPGYTGGKDLTYNFNPETKTLTITGGPVPYVKATGDGFPPASGNWIGVAIKAPEGFEGDIEELTINGKDYEQPILSDEEKARGELWYYFLASHGDATHTLKIKWSGKYEEEIITIKTSGLTLDAAEIIPLLKGNIAWDPGNTGGKGLNVNVDGNTITFDGEIEWYPADESLGRAAGHRVGVEIIPPEGFDAKEAVVTINGKGYKFGEDRFFWYPLVTEAGQEFTATVKWNEVSIQTFIVKIAETAILATESDPRV